MTTSLRSPSRGTLFMLFAFLHAARLSAQVTESPHTIAPGKLLFEVEGVRLSYDRADAAGNKYTGVAVASTIVSTGITDSFDVQVGADVFLRETFTFAGARDSQSGIGDVSFRMKWTVWRNEQRTAAVAVIPFVRMPTSTSAVGTDHVEGGFIVPWAMTIEGAVVAGAMFRWDQLRNDANDGYDAHWQVAAFAERSLTRMFSVYTETTFHVASTGFSGWTATLGVGALLKLSGTVQLDYELMKGLNRRATDWTHVLRVDWLW